MLKISKLILVIFILTDKHTTNKYMCSGLGKGVTWDKKVEGQLWDAIGSLTITLLKSKWKQPGKVYVVSIN